MRRAGTVAQATRRALSDMLLEIAARVEAAQRHRCHQPQSGAKRAMAESAQDTQNQALTAGDLLEYEDQTWVLVPGQYYDDIPNEAYHRGPGVSSSNLKTIGRSPLHYRTEKDHPKPSTPAMRARYRAPYASCSSPMYLTLPM